MELNEIVAKTFLSDNFLLDNKYAEELYFEHAAKMPIIDYHCHLPAEDIANNRKFDNLTAIWLDGDHYKWRALRANGIDERYITGNASPEEKFMKWAETVPYTLRNPLYHWTHLELKRYFGIDDLLNADSGMAIYNSANQMLQEDSFSCQGILRKMNVVVVCTTDDPIDSLVHHQQLKGFEVKILPTFRPDKAFAIDTGQPYLDYLAKLSEVSGIDAHSFDGLIAALENRIDYFHANGCRLSDHGLDQLFEERTDRPEQILQKAIKGIPVDREEARAFKQAVLYQLALRYHEKGWAQQYHLGALRNNNQRMLRLNGPDTGFDSIGDFSQASGLSKFLDSLDNTNQLAKTILYNLNPAHNEVMATMAGNYNDGITPGKMQFGSGWWFLDQKDGMEKQINALSNMGLLSRFVGMLTDSRSFMSFPRHEYFRRILCNLFGKDIKNGELPKDTALIGKIVEDICYNNAMNYFKF